jgi:hypothetical protein
MLGYIVRLKLRFGLFETALVTSVAPAAAELDRFSLREKPGLGQSLQKASGAINGAKQGLMVSTRLSISRDLASAKGIDSGIIGNIVRDVGVAIQYTVVRPWRSWTRASSPHGWVHGASERPVLELLTGNLNTKFKEKSGERQ